MMTEPPPVNREAGRVAQDGSFFRDINIEFLIHELKGPLAVIDTALRMLLEKRDKYGPLSDRQERVLQRARRNTVKAADLLADLLEVGRSDAGCFQCSRFQPDAVLADVLVEALEPFDTDLWESVAGYGADALRSGDLARHGIRLSCTDDARAAVVCQDEAKFRQIVGNLIKNALQHRRSRLEVAMDCREACLIVDVTDDGPGVEKENRERIFQRYTRLQECTILSRTRHGRGLAGAPILTRRLGGDITVKNHPGAGACFCLTLPLTYAEA